MSRKSPAQMLFERILRTWIAPEADRRQRSGPIDLQMALVVLEENGTSSVLLNDEVHGHVEYLKIVSTRAVLAGAPVTAEDIGGIEALRLSPKLWGKTCLLLVRGKGGKYYARPSRLRLLPESAEFKRVGERLAREGVTLTSGQSSLLLQFDLARNNYVGSPSRKRSLSRDLKVKVVEGVRKDALKRVKRHLRLPTFMVHHDDYIVPLLLEARQAYIDGLYFSAIASATTTADRICNGLLHRYAVSRGTIREILQLTLGQKVERLRAMGLIDASEVLVLTHLNRVRNQYLHPKQRSNASGASRAAMRSIVLLHKFFDQTESVFRDYTFEKGRLVPRPLA